MEVKVMGDYFHRYWHYTEIQHPERSLWTTVLKAERPPPESRGMKFVMN